MKTQSQPLVQGRREPELRARLVTRCRVPGVQALLSRHGLKQPSAQPWEECQESRLVGAPGPTLDLLVNIPSIWQDIRHLSKFLESLDHPNAPIAPLSASGPEQVMELPEETAEAV